MSLWNFFFGTPETPEQVSARLYKELLAKVNLTEEEANSLRSSCSIDPTFPRDSRISDNHWRLLYAIGRRDARNRETDRWYPIYVERWEAFPFKTTKHAFDHAWTLIEDFQKYPVFKYALHDAISELYVLSHPLISDETEGPSEEAVLA